MTQEDNKQQRYDLLLQQVKALIEDETDLVANLANTAAAIYAAFDHLWVGFYLVKPASDGKANGKEQLVLGPFQGPVACTRISYGRGVCGTAWAEKRTIVVPDVEKFPGHIACSSLSRSEIVVPMKRRDGSVWAVLDIDSERLSAFDDTDKNSLEELCRLIDLKA